MNTDRLTILFWLVLGLISMYGSIQLGLGTMQEPGSGFLAFLAAIFISLTSFIIFLQSFIRWRGVPLNLSAFWTGLNWHRPALIALLILGFILALERLGYILTSFFLLFVLFRWVENFSWKSALLIPVLTLGLTYLLFDVFLRATLPRGILGF
jgi:putative tricarboxylic transport membrane protein